MSRRFTVVMLAGALHPSSLQQQLNLPTLCLPVGWHGTLLDAWLRTIRRSAGCEQVCVVVNTEDDARLVRQRAESGQNSPQVRVMAEPAAWRGSAGLVRDLSREVSPEGIVVALEAHCLPAESLEPLLQALDGQSDGVVGADGDAEAAGMYAFRRGAIDLIPTIGYFDLKEQLLPALNRHGRRVRLVRVTECAIRIRDRDTFLDAVKASLGEPSNGAARNRCSAQAMVSPLARIVGWCIVEPDVVVEDGAVSHDSVLLTGAVVRRGAVVSRSVAAPLAEVSGQVIGCVINGHTVPTRGSANVGV